MVRPIIMRVQSVKRRRATPKKVVTVVKVTQSSPKKKTATRSIVVVPLTGSKRGKFNWMGKAQKDRARYRKGKKTSVVVKKVSQVKAVGLAPKEIKKIMRPFRG